MLGEVATRVRTMIREIARESGMEIHAGSVNRDHIHLLITIPPSISVSKALQYLKGKSSTRLMREFPHLKKKYWGQHFWQRGYWVASSGNVKDEVWKSYIENQEVENPDDSFNVI